MGGGALSVISKMRVLWSQFADREYREAFLDEVINSQISAQIFALRMSRGLTQAEVANGTGIAQPTLSRLEADANGITTSTLKRLANYYDVALSVRFVSYSSLVESAAVGSVDRDVPAFSDCALPKTLAIESRVTLPTSTRPITVKSVVADQDGAINLGTQKPVMELEYGRAI